MKSSYIEPMPSMRVVYIPQEGPLEGRPIRIEVPGHSEAMTLLCEIRRLQKKAGELGNELDRVFYKAEA